MPEIGQNLKGLVLKGIDAIGNTAFSLASTTRQKVSGMAMKGKRSDLLEALGEKIYAAWVDGTQFSDEITEILHEIMRLDEELKNLEKDEKAEKDVRSEVSIQLEDHANSDTVSEYKTEPDQAEKRQIPVIDVPKTEEEPVKKPLMSDAIDQLFGEKPQMDEMAGKINSSLDEMGKQLLQFSNDFGNKLSDMADDIMKDEQKNNQ